MKTARGSSTTPELLATFSVGFLGLPNKGELTLYFDRLVFVSGWEETIISFADLREVRVARASRWYSPTGHALLSLTYEDAGKDRTLLFRPGEAWFRHAAETRDAAAEWVVAIGKAAKAATGKALPEVTGEGPVLPASPWPALLILPVLFVLAFVPLVLPLVIAGIVGSLAIQHWHSRAGTRPRGSTQPVGVSPPRYSRTAIVGAVWAGLFFVGLVIAAVFYLSLGSYDVSGGASNPNPTPVRLLFFLSPILLPAVTAPFGTTILGLMAVSQIRRSAGRLYGLGLAWFDALLFPLLALDGLIGWFWLTASRMFMDFYANPALQNRPNVNPALRVKLANFLSDYPSVPILVALISIGLVDFFIIRRVWRGINKPLETTTANASAAIKSRALNPALIAAVAISMMLGVLGMTALTGYWHSRVGVSNSDVRELAVFGPIKEAKITLSPNNDSFFSFDTESYVPPPTDFDPKDYDKPASNLDPSKLWKWLTEHNVDLFVQRRDGKPVLAMSDMVVVMLREKDFERLSFDELIETEAWKVGMTAQVRHSVTSDPRGPDGSGGGVTIAFQTRYERVGMLRVVGVESDPPSVKIRYRLARVAPRNKAATSAATQPVPPASSQASTDLAQASEEVIRSYNESARPSASTGEPSNRVFGPVRERIITDEAMGQSVGLDVESGAIITGSRWSLSFEDQFRAKQADIYFVPGKREWRALDMTAISWNQPSLDLPLDVLTGMRWKPFRGTLPIEGFPSCYFQTREGSLGILQIVKQVEPPRGVKIRYKLAPAAASSSEGKLPGEGPDEVVDLHGAKVTQTDFETIARKPHLKRVNLAFSSVPDEGLKHLARLSELESLDLSRAVGNQGAALTDAGLLHLSKLTNLRTLKLAGHPITDAGLEKLNWLTRVERLQLGGTKVTGEGLRQFPALKWLRLDATPITDEGLRHVGSLTNLEQLYLDLTQISDAGLTHLMGLKKLRVLNLHQTKVTAEGVEALKRALPTVANGIGYEPQQAIKNDAKLEPVTSKADTDSLKAMLTEFPYGVWNKPLSHYARNRRPDGSFALINFPPAEDTWVNPAKLGLPADASAEQIAAKANGGDLYVPDLDHLAPVRGTKLAPLKSQSCRTRLLKTRARCSERSHINHVMKSRRQSRLTMRLTLLTNGCASRKADVTARCVRMVNSF
ncbi:MAG: hypothetical protein M3463_12915 [Verrucomicrobiota bacterium]|nr:hypothetical protein [Verrucomicrobiota bacterium]